MSTARESIEVAVPVEFAYEQLAHLERYPRFMSGIMSMAPIDASTAHMVLDIGGNRAEFDARITEARPSEYLCWEAIEGPQMVEKLRLEPKGDDVTRVIAELQVDAGEFLPGEPHPVEVLNRRLRSDLKGFRRFCEESEAEEETPDTTGSGDGESGKPRHSPATIARGIASAFGRSHATDERSGQSAPPTDDPGPAQHGTTDRGAHIRRQYDL